LAWLLPFIWNILHLDILHDNMYSLEVPWFVALLFFSNGSSPPHYILWENYVGWFKMLKVLINNFCCLTRLCCNVLVQKLQFFSNFFDQFITLVFHAQGPCMLCKSSRNCIGVFGGNYKNHITSHNEPICHAY
jgi:hypothetical protein